jgi:MscS family membrane protein
MRQYATLAAFLVATLLGSGARAQHPLQAVTSGSSAAPAPAAQAAVPATEPVIAADSPRAGLTRFLDLTRDADFVEAAGFLDLPPLRLADGGTVARRLKAVLDRFVVLDLERVSGLPGGNAGDGLPGDTDEIGTIPGPHGLSEPVRMGRKVVGGQVRWVFTRGTIDRVDAWYDRLENRWALELLPDFLNAPGPWGVVHWQWIALALLLGLTIFVARILSRATRRLLGRLTARTETTWDDEILARVGGVLTLVWLLALFRGFLPLVGLNASAEAFIAKVLRAGVFVTFFVALYRGADILGQIMGHSRWAEGNPASRAIVPLVTRIVKVVVFGIAVTAILSDFGYPVASLVAGLGLGGLALALAAQKTVENLFGAFSIGVDQPFRQGDTIKVDGVLGSVEQIGLRSTRIRTLDRTVVTIPNGKLADARVECYAARDRIRMLCTLGLTYSTTAAQLREVLAACEKLLKENPKVWQEEMHVRFVAYAESSLNIEIQAWFDTKDWYEFMRLREDAMLSFAEIVERSGSAFAFPTRTLHLAKGDSPL